MARPWAKALPGEPTDPFTLVDPPVPPLRDCLLRHHPKYRIRKVRVLRRRQILPFVFQAPSMYKKAIAATELLNKKSMASQAENHKLSEQLREKEEIMKKINEEAVRRPDEYVQE